MDRLPSKSDVSSDTLNATQRTLLINVFDSLLKDRQEFKNAGLYQKMIMGEAIISHIKYGDYAPNVRERTLEFSIMVYVPGTKIKFKLSKNIQSASFKAL